MAWIAVAPLFGVNGYFSFCVVSLRDVDLKSAGDTLVFDEDILELIRVLLVNRRLYLQGMSAVASPSTELNSHCVLPFFVS